MLTFINKGLSISSYKELFIKLIISVSSSLYFNSNEEKLSGCILIPGPPQFSYGHSTRFVFTRSTNAIIAVEFCSDPSPNKFLWKSEGILLEPGEVFFDGKFIAEPLRQVREKKRHILKTLMLIESRIQRISAEILCKIKCSILERKRGVERV